MKRNPSLKFPVALTSLLVAVASVWVAPGADPSADLIADRAAVERVYYAHRLGDKPPFEEVLPADQLRRLVQTDLAKETALKNVYGVEVTPALLAAEVQRINSTTRAPEMLVELKAALGNDPGRFANVLAKPILVERLLRGKFENDDALHAPQRRQAEQTRTELLAAKKNGADYEKLLVLLKRSPSNAVTETTWQFAARPEEKPAAEVAAKKRSGPDAQMLSSSPAGGKEQQFYFDDLPGELQRVWRAQLRQPGDVSAVIEMPVDFLVYVCQARTAERLSVATLSLPKRSYEQWLEALSQNKP